MIRRLLPRLILQLGMFICSATLVWSLWSMALAAETTNSAPAKSLDLASKASALTHKVIDQQFIQSHTTELSFWINQIPGMEEPLLNTGIPRWQYLASLPAQEGSAPGVAPSERHMPGHATACSAPALALNASGDELRTPESRVRQCLQRRAPCSWAGGGVLRIRARR